VSGAGGRAARPGGLIAIIVLKLIKGGLFVSCGVALLVYRRDPATRALLRLASWADGDPRLRLTAAVLRDLSSGFVAHFPSVVAACLVGGVAFCAEAAFLLAGYVWAPWLTIVLTGAWIPVEAYEFFRRGSSRIALVAIVNSVIVAYLYRHRGDFRRRLLGQRHRDGGD
jgi:hypothetical protein